MSDPVVLLSTGDVVGPAGGVTDNSMVLFSGTSGKLIKGNNAVVTAAGLALLDDVNAAAQRVTLGLGNVDNTSDINKPISTATQTALNLKATIDSPTFTGIPTAPTASAGTRSTAIATMQNFANEFGSSLAANGHQKLPSGPILQWGTSAAITSNSGVDVTFPVSFPVMCASVVTTGVNTADGYGSTHNVRNITTSGFRVSNGYGSQPGGIPVKWFAVGY